jgi:serine/threonine protein phosphatase PrpC
VRLETGSDVLRYAAATHTGLVRDINEDYHKVIKPKGGSGLPVVFIVADGMGGHNSGEVASRLAVECAEELFAQYDEETLKQKSIPDVVREIIERANTKVYEKACTDIEYVGMGTTVTMSVFMGRQVVTGHVGDSRLYLVSNSTIKRVTNDHSLIEELIRNGTITRAEASNHPNKHIITKALGCDRELTADIYETHINPGDKMLLCTDGLTNMVDDEEILNILTNEEEPENACKSLVEKAIKNGGTDNVTVIVVYV